MSLRDVRLPDGGGLALDGDGPFCTDALGALEGVGFTLPADDPFVHGTGDEAHAYLDASRRAWSEHLDHMDFLDEDSPVHHLKSLERDLYLQAWEPALRGAKTVMDVGAGVGRFALWALDRGLDVHAVDADLRSLHRLVWRAPGRPGRLDVHWSSVHRLPDVQVDAVVAAEVYCYVPEVRSALAHLHTRLRPGGTLCLSVEARWGWATAVDASPGAIGHALVGDGVLDRPGEVWVRTYTADDLTRTLRAAGFEVLEVVPHHYVLDGPLERVAPEEMALQTLLDLEAAARAHPVWSPLNRIWSVVARRPPVRG